ncbi:hypothetical protein, partial [Xenorhabdus cabanillasii]|uniref:hypothetical protein n=1 Tax=Xenorhabdus cabanillasii TaxID=351673 RepID=UPI002B4015E6
QYGQRMFCPVLKNIHLRLNTDDKRPESCTAITLQNRRASMISASTVVRRHLSKSAAITK